MKFLKKLLVVLLVLIAAGAAYLYWLTGSMVPEYEGEKDLTNIEQPVECTFDAYGIPVIEAQTAEDAYRVLGYVMASERLFQMELLRRVGKGTLAEALGRPGLEPDVFFRTAGISAYAKTSAQRFETLDPQIQSECLAFIDGINQFQEEGKMPLEFELIGLDPTPYTMEDMYAIAGYMAYSFSLGVRTDLLANELVREHGQDFLKETGLFAEDLPPFQPNCADTISFSGLFEDPLRETGIPPFIGSNAWAVNSDKSASGKPILCNDTHIGYAMPQVWYEACVSYPEFRFYGNFIPGIPYALVGHSDRHGWGMTMFENDDIDFYRERFDENGKVLVDSVYIDPVVREEKVAIGGEGDTTFQVVSTQNRPIMNGAIRVLDAYPEISMRWDYTQLDNKLLECFRGMAHSRNVEEFETILADIHAPGLNAIYADAEDNIGWWACAKVVIHPEGINPKSVIDGSDTENAPLGYRDFSRNPHCLNPPSGFVSSANERPAQVDTLPIYGYYVPPSRGKRIRGILDAKSDWTVEDMKTLMLDVTNDDESEIAGIVRSLLEESNAERNATETACIALLEWDGAYNLDSKTPVLYQPLQMRLIQSAMLDKMSEQQFARYLETHWMRRTLHIMLKDPNHSVWDVSTTDEVETMSFHAERVFPPLCQELAQAYGNDVDAWEWGKAHTWGPKHLFADQPVIGDWLSLDPVPMFGSNETISQSGFTASTDIRSHARFGAQMRIIMDMGDVPNSLSVSPTGQSGHKRSPHFQDQAALYVGGQFRGQTMYPSESGKKSVFK